ncbi:MAG: hypothetical protein H0X66_17140 [Verrucomicrobia bacterium]|nr:hypothetical protein [Verrucomicrobiota bacterium]
MKTTITAFCSTLLLAAAVCLNAEEPAKAKTGSPEFERMKTLVGTWEGQVDMGQGPIDMQVQYRLLAGGSVLEERCFIGTPNEMVTMYYDQKGKLALTHYCVMGNRPGMVLGSSNDKTLKFDFDKSCGIDVKKESHMHAMTLTFNDSDTITTTCKAFMDGKEVPESSSTFKRVKL